MKCQAQTPARAPLNSTVRTHKSLLQFRTHHQLQLFVSAAPECGSGALTLAARSSGRKRCSSEPPRSIASPGGVAGEVLQRVKVSEVAPLGLRRHSLSQLREAPFDPVSRKLGIRQRGKWPVAQSTSSRNDMCALTPRWSGRGKDKVPSPDRGSRAAQLNR